MERGKRVGAEKKGTNEIASSSHRRSQISFRLRSGPPVQWCSLAVAPSAESAPAVRPSRLKEALYPLS
nr:hypothetical protein CFP56_13542 [Quercus suber]